MLHLTYAHGAMQLDETVESAYALFRKYTIGTTLDVCKVCCVTDAEERELVNTPLRAVSRSLLQNAYYESARSGSDRELWEMKHFLPRVLELVADFEFPCHSTEITFTRLDLEKSEKWLPPEHEMLADFSVGFFKSCLAVYPLPKGEDIAGILIMFGIGHFDLQAILNEWLHATNPESLLHFKDLLLNEIEYKEQQIHRLTNPFSTAEVDECVAEWLNNATVKPQFAEKIENLLVLNSHNFDDETVAGLSWAHKLMES